MSYCRFTDGDVYAYETEGGVQFWTAGKNLDRLCNTFDEAYRYAKELRDVHGLDVPSYAIEALREDALEEAKRIGGNSRVIGELQAENAKLQERVEWLDAECRKSMGASSKFFEMIGEYQKENAKLRELALKLWDIAMSERSALSAHGINQGGDALDVEIRIARDKMRELGLEES